MTDNFAEIKSLQTRAQQSKQRSYIFAGLVGLSLLGLAGSVAAGSMLTSVLIVLVTIMSGVGVAITRSRHTTALSEFQESCTQEAKRSTADGETAIRAGSLEEAQSAFKQAARFGEIGASEMDQSTEKWVADAEEGGITETLPLIYAVSTTYLELLGQYRNSRYDYSGVNAKFTDITADGESGVFEQAVTQLIDVAESLTEQSSAIETVEKPAGYDADTELTVTQERVLREAGYDSPAYVAHLSVDVLADLLDIERSDAKSIRTSCRSLIDNTGYIGRLVEDDDSISSSRGQWNEVAIHLQDQILAETTSVLETGLELIAAEQQIHPNDIASLRESLRRIWTDILEASEPLVRLRESTPAYQWVTVDLSIIAPVEALQGRYQASSSQTTGHILAIATADLEAIIDRFVISRSEAREARETALNQLAEQESQYEQLVSAVSRFTEYQQILDYTDEWTVFDERVQEADDALERVGERHNPSDTGLDALATARDQIEHLESLLDKTAFPNPVRIKCKQQYDDLSERLTETEASIRNQHQRLLEETTDLIERAEDEAVVGDLETAKVTLQEADDIFPKDSPVLEPDEISTVEIKYYHVDSKVTPPLFQDRIKAFEADVQTIREEVDADTDAAERRLSAIETNLDDLQSDFGREVRDQDQAQKLVQAVNEVREFVSEVYQEIGRRDAEETRQAAWNSINQAGTLVKDGEIDQANATLQKADSRLQETVPPLDESEISDVRTAIERVEDQISAARFAQTIDAIESSLRSLQDESHTDVETLENELETIVARVDSLWDEIQTELTTLSERQEFRQRIDTIEQEIDQVNHEVTVQKETQLLEQADGQLKDARESIEAGQLRVVPAKIESAVDSVQEISAEELDRNVDAFHQAAASVRAQLHEAYVRLALEATTHELSRAKGYIQHDVGDTRDRLTAARTHIHAADHLLNSYTPSSQTTAELQEKITSRHSEIQTLADKCREKEITTAIEATSETVEQAETVFEEGNPTDARELIHEAESRLESVPDEAATSKTTDIQTDIEELQTTIAQYEISEYIQNAEDTVNRAEAERAAGEVVEAIEAYQRAISTYEAAKVEAESVCTPERYEISVRIDQLSAEIENVREQSIKTRTHQIDRELRAGERAIAQGLDAVQENNLELSEEKYDSADEAANGAKKLLNGSLVEPSGGELTLPTTLDTEYQSAYSSLVGHLGYLRTQIQEAKESETVGDTASTPLAEYYDGLYTVYRALPDNTHPVWHEAITAVLFGGEGLTDTASGYGTQQAERTDAQISTLRETSGNGERITEFNCIVTAAACADDQEFLSGQEELPVTPDSGTVIPIDLDEDTISDAIELLSEFPAVPKADDGKHDSDPVINISYFEDQLATKADIPAQSHPEKSTDTEKKSEELESLMDQIEAEIDELRDTA